MAVTARFKLKDAMSYSFKRVRDKSLMFWRKGEIKEIQNAQDIQYFRARPDVVLEVDADGRSIHAIGPGEVDQQKAKSYKKYKPRNRRQQTVRIGSTPSKSKPDNAPTVSVAKPVEDVDEEPPIPTAYKPSEEAEVSAVTKGSEGVVVASEDDTAPFNEDDDNQDEENVSESVSPGYIEVEEAQEAEAKQELLPRDMDPSEVTEIINSQNAKRTTPLEEADSHGKTRVVG